MSMRGALKTGVRGFKFFGFGDSWCVLCFSARVFGGSSFLGFQVFGFDVLGVL